MYEFLINLFSIKKKILGIKTSIIACLIMLFVTFTKKKFNYKEEKFDTKYGEKVTTTNFTTSKTKKNIEKFANHHYIKSPFLVDHYYNITASKMAFLLITTSKLTKITTTKIRRSKRMRKKHQESQFCLIFTYQLPMA